MTILKVKPPQSIKIFDKGKYVLMYKNSKLPIALLLDNPIKTKMLIHYFTLYIKSVSKELVHKHWFSDTR